jgi:hypothetical protein
METITQPVEPDRDNVVPGEAVDPGYWYELIPETKAAEENEESVRTWQSRRQTGEGPLFVRISSRCIRYRRIDIFRWAESRLRKSTSDIGG